MYSETDESNHSTAPSADRLDPLQNPLLNQHMGRWAEVYCTTPPEQRDQAVSELLLELEAEQREQATVSREQTTRGRRKFAAVDSIPSSAARSAESEHREFVTTSQWQSRQTSFPADGFTSLQASAHDARHADSADPEANDNHDDGAEPDDSDSFHFSSYSGGSSSSYRVYIGIVLALIIAFLAYRAWLSTKSAADNAQGPSPVPPAASAPNAAQRAPSAQPTTPSPSPAPPAQSPPNVAPSVAANPVPPASAKENDQPEGEAPHPVPSAPGSGSTELSMAKSYLNGTDGKARNPSDAIALLWEAVGKKNAEATELLANAYLTGEGVSKNCDQARVLLDAAARKGRTGAGERLRHLQAFGCQ